MAIRKPPEISDEAWEKTPPSVRALLTKTLAEIQPPQADPHGQATWVDPSDDEATVAMPPPADLAADSDGATVFMPEPPPPAADDGATAYMPVAPPPSTTAAGDEATAAMPLPPSGDDDGGTVLMPDTPSPRPADDAETIASPLSSAEAEDGATAYMPSPPGGPADKPTADDDGATAYMPSAAAASETAPAAVKQTVVLEYDDLWEKNIVLQERYRLRKILGKGGFGAAYLAEDVKLKRGCVVKQMLSREGGSPQELETSRENFEREASMLVQLNHPGHPNIPEIYDYFSDKTGSYLVMKYIEGHSLKGVMQQAGGAIDWQEAARYLIDVCSALDYMHTRSGEPVLHRDIKPDNILLGNDGRIWLVDFGLAQAKPVESTGDLSQAQAAGSVGYTPFEQWLGEAVPASDVYAAGVTLHHLITGHSPIEAYRESDGHVKINVEKLQDLHGRLDPIRKINRSLPRDLEEVVAHTVAADPSQRFTAQQFQEQLQVLVSGAKNAALFTFKNGLSARTISELVDLCEQNRVEAQGYLYRGDFERWFTLINRNDLAEAANKAVTHGEKGKDGLERFLKLIMPNIFLRRLWKATKRIGRAAALALIIFVVAGVLAVAAGTLTARWLIERTIANANWDYYALVLDSPNEFTEGYLTENAHRMSRAYLEDIYIDPQSAGQVEVRANLANIAAINIPVELRFEQQQPVVTISEINGIPFYWITQTLSDGINRGIAGALQRAPVAVTGLEVSDNSVIVNVARNEHVVWNPPVTPEPQVVTLPTPLPTATPRGEALLAIFNDLDQDLVVDIGDNRWVVPAHDSKAIEHAPGTYTYNVRYASNGQLAASGTKTWTFRAYKWRIGVNGEQFE